MSNISYAYLYSKDGIWENEKLQFYITVKGNIFNRYQYTNLSCFKGGAGFLPSTGFISKNKLNDYFPYSVIGDQMTINRPQENLFVKLRRVKKMPYACKGEPVDTIMSNFYIFWQTINEIYSFSHLEKNKWLKVFHDQLPSLTDLDMRLFENRLEEDIYLLTKFEEILYQVADPHLFIIAPSVQKTIFADSSKNHFLDIYSNKVLLKNWLQVQSEKIKGEFKWFANNNILVIIQDNILYVNVLKLTGLGDTLQYDESAKENLKLATSYISNKLTPDTKVIIDLRFNDGGSVKAANVISSLFSNTKQVVTYIQLEKNTTKEPLSYNDGTGITPYCIAILTSKFTASAGEYLTLNMASQNGFIVGEKTRGAFSPVILKSLPNKWILGIPPFDTFDGKFSPLPESVGIIPQKEISWNIEPDSDTFDFNLNEYASHCKK